MSIFLAFLIFPALINLDFVKGFLIETRKEIFIAITAIVLLLTMYSWEKARNLWQRYKNTHALEKPPFVWLDWIFLFIFSSALLIALFQKQCIPTLSLRFKVFASINLTLIVVWFLSTYFWKEKKKEIKPLKTKTYELSDESIQFAEQDLLGRGKFIEDLYREITNLPFIDSFAFGLYGSWGEGKTSVINLLKNKFKENGKFLMVNFDPWYYKDEEAILTALYGEIERVVSEKFILPDFKNTLAKYQKLISLGMPHQTGIRIDFSFPEESLKEVKERIESYIAQIKKKIIVFIDDIDRL